MNASPAPSTFSTSTVTPRPLKASSSERGIAPSITAQPIGPRFTTSVAAEILRTASSDAMMSVEPPAMLNSSIVPIARSIFGRMLCRCAVTDSDCT